MKHGVRQGGGKGPAGRGNRGDGAGRSAAPPRSNAIAGLQQTHGNRFVTRALSVQRKCECGGVCAKCKAVQRKGGDAPGPITPALSSYLASPGGGQALGSPPRGGAGQLAGSFDGVRVHNGSRAHAAAKALDARALTVGSNIFFSAGRYQPATAAGSELLSHELAHVAQQRNGSVGSGLVEDGALEKEADDVAAGRASDVRTLGRTGIQRQPEDKDSKKKKDDEEEEKSAPKPAEPKKDKAPELRLLDLLPNSLRPELQPEETDSERMERQLSDDLKASDRAKGITHLQGPPAASGGAGHGATPDPKGVTEAELAAAARALLSRCNRDQKDKGDPDRRQTEEGPPKTLEEKDNGAKIKDSIEACLDTKEGEAFTAKAKSYLLNQRGAPVTVGAVGALLANFAISGKILYIPPIPLGKDAELSIEIDGPVDKPDQAMIKLKIKDVSSFGGTLWKGLKAVGGGIATFAGWIWKGLKAIGSGIATFAGWIWTGVKWLARKIFDKIVGILGRVVSWMLKLPFRLARLLKTLIEGVAALRPWSLKFWESLGHAGTWGDFLKWLGTVGLEIAELGGVGEIYETAVDLVKFNTRTLKDDEREAGGKVFGSTVPWHLVRIDEAAVLGPASTKREYTSFHTINGWGDIALDTLIHELTHVWQYESAGAIYMPQALHAQATAGYNYGDLPGLRAARAAGQGILSFNREQQAQIVQDFFRIAQGSSPMMSSGSKADQPLYASFVKDVSSHQEAYLASLRV